MRIGIPRELKPREGRVGLIPAAALNAAAEYYLQIAGFKGDQVLENKLRAVT